jgi:hypothetical protein
LHIDLRLLTGGERILAGAQPGRSLFGQLVAKASAPSEPEPAFLDFSGVEVATASFLRESVVAFRDYARSTVPNLYPVVANAVEAITEELAFFLRHRSDAVWACDIDAASVVRNARLIGELDDVQRETFDRVLKLGAATAPTLAAAGGSEAGVGPTAWNNRLSNLVNRGLLIERRGGKTKTFAPVLEVN